MISGFLSETAVKGEKGTAEPPCGICTFLFYWKAPAPCHSAGGLPCYGREATLRSEQKYHAEGVEERYAFPSVNVRVVFFCEKSPPSEPLTARTRVFIPSTPTGTENLKRISVPRRSDHSKGTGQLHLSMRGVCNTPSNTPVVLWEQMDGFAVFRMMRMNG